MVFFITMAYCYILHSNSLNRYYTGSTVLSPEERLKRHQEKYYGTRKFTAKANDWKIFFIIECISIEQAKRIESHIKKMKSKKYIENLVKFPQITQRLLEKYK